MTKAGFIQHTQYTGSHTVIGYLAALMAVFLLAMKYISILLLFLLAGCANSTPYIEAEIKYAFPFSTDYWVHQDHSWTCNQPYQLDLEIGHEWKNGWSGGLYHESFFLCGRPFNHVPEIYENGIFAKKKWGGW